MMYRYQQAVHMVFNTNKSAQYFDLTVVVMGFGDSIFPIFHQVLCFFGMVAGG
jgi:hypothetical protein